MKFWGPQLSTVTLTITGLVCDMIGASALGYELLFGYPKYNRMKTEQIRLVHLDKFIEDINTGIDGLASPPYTLEEKAQMKTEFYMHWNSKRDLLVATVHDLTEGHRETSYLAGWFGILMLLLGFSLQIAGALAM